MRLTMFLKSNSILPQVLDSSGPLEQAHLDWEHAQGGIGRQDVWIDLREDRGLTVIASEAIQNRKVVRVREGGSVYYTEVLSSRSLRDGFEIELAFLDQGRRRETRVAAEGAVKVESGEARGDDAIQAEVVNISTGGLQLLCDRPVGAGETIRIVGENVEKLCRVRYCIKVAEGYRVGLQFCEGLTEADAQG